ncbi:MAG: N-6 DNA methylase [candidate division KSB1 bacterium]|nr:N-6 DNA methylase [candidate division KSB1 bacterium]
MPQLEHIKTIEKRLWSAADTLRANSNYASNEYFLPVMGLIFLRHAYSRFLAVKDEIVAGLPKRNGKTRPLSKEDFSRRNAIYLRPEAQFDHLVSLPGDKDRVKAVIKAMESIEQDYDSLKGILPKSEYQELDNDVLQQMLEYLNPDALKQVSGDVFGRIYEYFLTKFADLKAHDNGEFFTPVSLVSMIAHVLDPNGGIVLDPACGSGGMFVQSARTVREHGDNPAERLTFYGMEKNSTTIRLAQMNLAVHGLEGNIQKAITYYQDPHALVGKADYVMANPPFNVDEIDADSVKSDSRMPFGLPGKNKNDKVPNGNYVWISFFYSYLNETGRAGFVMSSQASSAGRDEAKVRQKLIETGAVDIMMAIRSNFFYTRSVPCELWFLNRDKPKEHRDKVLMIDARNVYRQVTRKIYDFSPEQEQNLLAMVWLYRGQTQRYLDLVAGYCQRMLDQCDQCLSDESDANEPVRPLSGFATQIHSMREAVRPFVEAMGHAELDKSSLDYEHAVIAFEEDVRKFKHRFGEQKQRWAEQDKHNGALKQAVERLSPLAEASRDLIKQADLVVKQAAQLLELCENDYDAKAHDAWPRKPINQLRKKIDAARAAAVETLKPVRYVWKQAHWLTERFPDAELCDVEGLVKRVDHAELQANDWSLTPGRYVGVAPEEEDEDFDFEETLREIHTELDALNAEAVELAERIKRNFEELGI